MEPLPETVDALRTLADQGDTSLGLHFFSLAEDVMALVPDRVGVSLSVAEDGVTLTLVASAEQIAALDAVQYADGGPCVAAIDDVEPLHVDIATLLDEDRWALYARASAAAGIASSLSLPVVTSGRVVGGVNLYASTPDAFTGKHAALAEVVGSDARLAVANADLSFETRRQAMEAPTRVRESGDVAIALGIIAASQGVTIAVARERLRHAAAQAGITEAQAARALRHIRA